VGDKMAKEMYLYNTNTDKLHIKGYCQHASERLPNYISFCSEDEALAYGGRSVSFCKSCQKKRDKMMTGREE